MVWETASGYDIHIDFDFGVCGTSALDGRVWSEEIDLEREKMISNQKK